MVWGLGWGVLPVDYADRDDTHIIGITGYIASGKLYDGDAIVTGYYNPNAYWTPTTTGDTPPPGGDPSATVGQDPTTLVPPAHNPWTNRPYHYADLKVYDQMGKNRTGGDLPDDPYDSDDHPVTFLYDDQDPVNSNLSAVEWAPDGDSTRNQQVSLFAANTEKQRGKRAIARNVNSWREIGVYSDWDSVSGQNSQAVSKENLGGHAKNIVERYGRVPNFFTLTLPLEPASAWPEFGAIDHHPQPFRDFGLGDRIKVRMRMGYIDSGLINMRIMKMTIEQADADNNVNVKLECVPHMTETDEISVSYYPEEDA
jgi:hypothetical protein